MKPGTTAAGPGQKEAPSRIRVLTDISAVAKYADRIGARARSLRKLVIEEQTGRYFRTVAQITFDREGVATAPDDVAPTPDEAAAIKAAWKDVRWPEYQPALYTGKHLPENEERFPWSKADPVHVAVCWDRERKHILCVEERRPRDDGGKGIWIWTPWDDGDWRVTEPPDSLPLFGLDTIANAATIFVHEGPRKAQMMQALIADDSEAGWKSHPWGKELRGQIAGAVAHVGWMGGAERPETTDWRPLIAAGARIIVVADNDRPGLDAVGRISRATGMRMEVVCFTDDFPPRFDLADPFPADRAAADCRLADLLYPATWATEVVATGARPSYRLRREFITDWRYTVSPPLFFHAAYPGRGFGDAEVDAMIRPFSDAEMTARLIRQHLSARADGVAYLPGREPLIERNGQRLVNMWKPTRVRERAGSAWPLGRLLTHAFPDREDRRHCARWGSTLSADPITRMEYAVLMQSVTQGLGKTTLCNLLAELVGPENVSRPNEVALTEGNFNSHLAKKRLVIVDEIYSGHSKKTYNRLKSPITDKTVRVNEKYQPEHEMDNYAHFIFNSNDMISMLLDPTDRRFFIPLMSETKLPRAFWVRFHAWLADGGLGIMLRCSREFIERHGGVKPGEAAPMSAAKRAMIENSVSDEMRAAREAARDLFELGQGDDPKHITVTLEDFHKWHGDLCRDRGWRRLTGNRLNDEIRKSGLTIRTQVAGDRDKRIVVAGRKMAVLCNFEAEPGIGGAEAVREALRAMSNLGFEGPL